MGLDNGIMIKRTENLPRCVETFDEDWRKKHNFDLEVAYWRKCWNVRNVIYNTLNQPEENDSEIEMSYEDVLAVINELNKISYNNFYDGAGCIWTWNEFRNFQKYNIKQLKKLAGMMKRHPEIVVYFYDSY